MDYRGQCEKQQCAGGARGLAEEWDTNSAGMNIGEVQRGGNNLGSL